MKTKMYIRRLAVVLAVVLCCGALPVTAIADLRIGTTEEGLAEEAMTKRQKISHKLLEKMEEVSVSNPMDEKIPVYIWYEDINQTKVLEEVEKRTGLTLEDLDTNLEMPSKGILEGIESFSNNTTIEEITYYSNKMTNIWKKQKLQGKGNEILLRYIPNQKKK